MSEAETIRRPVALDNPLRRLPWLVPAAIAAWVVMLAFFARVLEQRPSQRTELPINNIEARIVEEKPVAGLAPSAPARAAAPMKMKARPLARPAPRPAAPPLPAASKPNSQNAIEQSPKSGPNAESSPSAESNENSGESNDSGAISGEGDADAGGARATYSPPPDIPDDLRDEPLDTEAVAHFTVARDGTFDVALSTPTPNARLNQVILAALKRWRFEPAMRDGATVDAEFDVRIPISIR